MSSPGLVASTPYLPQRADYQDIWHLCRLALPRGTTHLGRLHVLAYLQTYVAIGFGG